MSQASDVERSTPRLLVALREIVWLLVFAFFVPVVVLLIGVPIAALIRLVESLFSR
jgi:hypothetical protein